MSSSAQPGPEVPGGKKKGLLSRMKTVLKRSDGSKRLSFSSKPTPSAEPSSSAVVAGPSTTTSPPAPLPTTEPTPAPIEASTEPEKPIPAGASLIMRSQIAAERARKLGERFSVPIEPLLSSISSDKPAYRVEKPIRMRIHRVCHKCNTSFGNNKICASCQHTRCKGCPRYPVKKTPEQKAEKKEKEVEVKGIEGVIEPDTYYGLRETIILMKPNPKTGGQPLVRKKPMQRVRRTCHECESLFAPGSKICPRDGCGHVRCADCPRDPAKKHKFPDGYPGDAPSTNPSKPIKYACAKCNKTFPPVPNPLSPEGAAWKEKGEKIECQRCGHPLGPDCKRAKPIKVENGGVDEDVLERVRVKLQGLGMGMGGGGGM